MANRKRPLATSPLEWITAIFGGLIGLGLLGVIGREAVIRSPNAPIAIVIETVRVTAVPEGFTVEIAAHNRGDDTAAAVQIEGSLHRDGAVVETSQATIDYVPGHARRRGGLLFSRNPGDYRLEVRATGYQEP